MEYRILTVNPGSTSTKVGCFEGEKELFTVNVSHEAEKLKEFESQVEYLKTTNDTLINISGSYFYNFTPEENLIINLVKEEDNEHDPDAIAAYLNGQKIGYVANSDYTLIDEVKSASKIKNLIKDDSQAKILFIYLDEYIIAKLL